MGVFSVIKLCQSKGSKKMEVWENGMRMLFGTGLYVKNQIYIDIITRKPQSLDLVKDL
jgi:hypothetical protein